MSPKKQYQKRLPTILPPAPRRAPEQESRPAEAPPRPPAPPAPPAPPLPPAPVRPATAEPHRRSWRAAAALGVALVVLVGAVGTALVIRRTSDDPPDRRQPPVAAEGFPAAGESRTLTEVRPDGVLEVTHWIHTVEPIGDLDLSLPEMPRADSVEVSDVEVIADEQPGAGPPVISLGSASYYFIPATRILVRYRMSGAVELSSSAAGRGLATTTALEVSAPRERDTRVVRSRMVLSLACVGTAGAAAAPCGVSAGDRQWRVDLTGDEVGARVLAAVTVS